MKMLNKIKRVFGKIKLKRYNWSSLGINANVSDFSVVNAECVSIGNNFYAENNLKLQAWKSYGDQNFFPHLRIGNGVSIMENCQISCCDDVNIGDGCLFGANVFVTDNFHGDNSLQQLSIPPVDRPLLVKGQVHIGSNVWVGRNVCIMPGVMIGDGAVIGANSVVTHDVPAQCIAAGIPAKVIRKIG